MEAHHQPGINSEIAAVFAGQSPRQYKANSLHVNECSLAPDEGAMQRNLTAGVSRRSRAAASAATASTLSPSSNMGAVSKSSVANGAARA